MGPAVSHPNTESIIEPNMSDNHSAIGMNVCHEWSGVQEHKRSSLTDATCIGCNSHLRYKTANGGVDMFEIRFPFKLNQA